MRRVSLKRQRLNRSVKSIRDEYRAEFPMCQWCVAEPACDLHEISRGSGRQASLGVRAALLSLCRPCHDVMDWLPVVAQLAVKKLSCSGYDRIAVNRLRGRSDNAIDEDEVELWCRRFGSVT